MHAESGEAQKDVKRGRGEDGEQWERRYIQTSAERSTTSLSLYVLMK